MTLKGTLGIIVVVFIVFYALTSPDQAANIFHSTWTALVNIAHGFGRFIDKITS